MSSTPDTAAPADCVGPEYRPDAQKPTATVSTKISYPNVHILPQTPQLIALLTYARPCLEFSTHDEFLNMLFLG